MIKTEAKNKIAYAILNMLSHMTYKLDGEPKRTDFFQTSVIDGRISINVYLKDPLGGSITDIFLIDKDGEIFAEQFDVIQKPSNNGFYFTFEYEVKEG